MENFAKNGKKILGAVLNYRDQNLKKPEAPILFLKPSTSFITEGEDIIIPKVLSNVVHEVELGLGRQCRNVPVDEAHQYIGGYCLGLDLSAMCEINAARANGFPWSMGKGFDTSNPVVEDLYNLDLHLSLISYASKYMTLEAYDLITTGTPKGAEQITAGDIIEAGISEKGHEIVKITFNVK